jgi:O-antigen ligase
MDRGIVIAMVPIMAVELFARDPLLPKKMWVSFLATLVIGLIGLRMIAPVIFEDRTTGSSNIDQRIAQFGETMNVVRDHPLFGIGFGSYHDIVGESPQYLNRWHGIESMTRPHSVVMRVISEEGILGLLLYAGCFGCGVYSLWKMRKANPLAAKAALYPMLILIITGFDFDLVSPPDLNMFYAFGIGVLLQAQIVSTAAINVKKEVSQV